MEQQHISAASQANENPKRWSLKLATYHVGYLAYLFSNEPSSEMNHMNHRTNYLICKQWRHEKSFVKRRFSGWMSQVVSTDKLCIYGPRSQLLLHLVCYFISPKRVEVAISLQVHGSMLAAQSKHSESPLSLSFDPLTLNP